MPTPYEIVKQWRADNPERLLEQRRRYRQTEAGKAKHRRDVAAYRKREPEKHRARNKLWYALKTGKVQRTTHCERCGASDTPQRDGRSSLHAHHADYSKPLDVEWLCSPCHLEVHG